MLAVVIAGAGVMHAGVASADEVGASGANDVELRHDLWIDVPVTAGLAGVLVAYSFVRDDIVAKSCHWCEEPRPDGVNAIDTFFRDALVRRDTNPARLASHVVSYGVAPLGAAVLLSVAAADNGTLKHAPVDLLLTAEATLTAMSVLEVVKATVSRERPNVHAEPDEEKRAQLIEDGGAFASFASGHTLSVFAITASAGTIASMRGYRIAPLIWIAGSMLGVAAAYLRVAADQHYFTDTLGGAALGMGIGAGVPWLFHRPTNKPRWMDGAALGTQPVAGGRVVSLTVPF